MNAKKARWKVVDLLDKLPTTCRASLITWAVDGGQDKLRNIGLDGACIRDTERCGACWCGKLRSPGYDDPDQWEKVPR